MNVNHLNLKLIHANPTNPIMYNWTMLVIVFRFRMSQFQCQTKVIVIALTLGLVGLLKKGEGKEK